MHNIWYRKKAKSEIYEITPENFYEVKYFYNVVIQHLIKLNGVLPN